MLPLFVLALCVLKGKKEKRKGKRKKERNKKKEVHKEKKTGRNTEKEKRINSRVNPFFLCLELPLFTSLIEATAKEGTTIDQGRKEERKSGRKAERRKNRMNNNEKGLA